MRNPQLEAAIRDYIEEKQKWAALSKTTCYAREKQLLAFAAGVDCTTLARITAADIEQWYQHRLREIKPTSADTQLKAVKGLFRWLVARRRLRTDPSADLKPATSYVPSDFKFCTAADVDRLLAAAPSDELRFVILCGFDLGMKTTEIAEARWRWFRHRSETKLVNVENSKHERRQVPITLRMLELIMSLAGDYDGASFVLKPEVERRTLDQRGLALDGAFADLAAAQGLPWLRIGALRQSFAVEKVKAGVSYRKLANWLGVSRRGIVSQYGQFAKVDA